MALSFLTDMRLNLEGRKYYKPSERLIASSYLQHASELEALPVPQFADKVSTDVPCTQIQHS